MRRISSAMLFGFSIALLVNTAVGVQSPSGDGELFLVLRDGAGPDFNMKGYKGRMSDTDMWNAINYLRSIGPKN